MTKDHILREIKRTATENGGIPLGAARFEAATGIRKADCVGVYWARWNDALIEAGFQPNRMNAAYDENFLMRKYAELALELGRLPTKADVQIKGRGDTDFPTWNTFSGTPGTIREFRRRVADFCLSCPDLIGFAALVPSPATYGNGVNQDRAEARKNILGYVYLLKHGTRREFKIGRTTNALRREGEIAIELPQKVQPVHVISTDDPSGIETYWHNRFAKKRKNGEWFELSAEDVAAFKRRKFM